MVLLGTVAFSASKMLYQGKVLGEIQVGVVLPKEDALSKQVLSMMSSLESVSSLCKFLYVQPEEGREMLKKGEIYALMEVPEGFIEGIISGTNTPVNITFPKNAGMEASVLRALTDSGARTLGVAQAAIYAADEFCMTNGLTDSIPVVEGDLNSIYMKYSLSRSVYFIENKVSAAGDLTTLDYYGISAAMLFLLLCGIPAANLLKPQSRVLSQKLRAIGIGRFKAVAARVTSITVLLLMISFLMLLGLTGMGKLTWSVGLVFSWLLVCLACASLILFFYELSGSLMAGVMLLFMASVGMVFLSGGFIPAVFLPEGVAALGRFMPTTFIMNVMKGMINGFDWNAVLRLLLMEVCLLAGTAAVRRQNG